MRKKLLFFSLMTAFLMALSACSAESEANRASQTAGSGTVVSSASDIVIAPECAGILPAPKKKHTVMIYMIGSNLESTVGNATRDMAEAMESGFDPDTSNVIAYTGGSSRWLGRLPSQQNNVVDLSKPMGQQIVAQTGEICNMGAPETLADFINFAVQNFPAEHYGLIFWDHGGGPLWGYGSDELFEEDSLSLRELTAAMQQTPFGEDRKLDWVGFDACLMGSLECMLRWEQYAHFYIASEELEPGSGWDYGFLKVLNQTEDTGSIARQIVRSFEDYYRKHETDNYRPDTTLSCIDLSKISGLAGAFGELAQGMQTLVSDGRYPMIQKLRTRTIGFGRAEVNAPGAFDYDLVDLGNLAEQLRDSLPEAADAVLAALRETVTATGGNMPNTCGISLYYPFYNKSQYTGQSNSYYSSPGVEYTAFLKLLTQSWLQEKASGWKLPPLEKAAGEWTLTLTPEQQANQTAVYYSVFEKQREDTYTSVLKHIRIEPDDQGVVHIPENPKILCFADESGSYLPCRMAQISDQNGIQTYRTIHAWMLSHTGAIFDCTEYPDEQVDMAITIGNTEESDELKVYTVNCLEGDSVLSGKTTLNPEKYSAMLFFYRSLYPQYDDEGQMLPYDEWSQENAWLTLSTAPMVKQFRFAWVPCAELDGTWAIQCEVMDMNGDTYATSMEDIRAAGESVIREWRSGDLCVRCECFDDHAEIVSVESNREDISLPSKIGGVPITKIQKNAFRKIHSTMKTVTLPDGLVSIAPSAFSGCIYLKSIRFPDSLQEIGSSCFSSCFALEEIRLPHGLRFLGKEAFTLCKGMRCADLPMTLQSLDEGLFNGCDSLEMITAEGKPDGKCDAFSLKNGVLFSADGTLLLSFPAGRTGSYIVPGGTKDISYAAFRNAQIESVSFPASLEKIGNYAFYNCKNLKVPKLPSGLSWIGFQAFGAPPRRVTFPGTQEKIPVIRIGPKVTFIGDGAFDCFAARSFAVDAANPCYSSVEGNLCVDAGTQLLIAKLDGTPRVNIPEGIVTFRWDAFTFFFDSLCESRLDLTIPTTVTKIFGQVPEDADLVLHGSRNTYAYQYAGEHDLVWEGADNP